MGNGSGLMAEKMADREKRKMLATLPGRARAAGRVFWLAWLALLPALALPAHAELVVLVDGSVMKVRAYELDGERARVTFLAGGRMTLDLARIERVVDDEVAPEPDPPAAANPALAAGLAGLPLRFDEHQSVPDGPWGGLIYEAARHSSLNPRVVAAVIEAESAGNARAVSRVGARGLMQLMPATAERFGVPLAKLFDPVRNLEAGTRYLSWLIDQFSGDLPKVLAAYNAGENAVLRYGGVPPYRETQAYVRHILGTLGIALGGAISRPVQPPAAEALTTAALATRSRR